jgi:protein TonB
MENDFKVALFVSLAVHASIFLLTSVAFRRSTYIVLPVELFFYNPPSASVSVPVPPSAAPTAVIQKAKDKEEVALPSKKKEKPRAVQQPPAPDIKKQEATKPAPPSPVTGNDTLSRNFTPTNQISLDTAKFPFSYYTNTIVKKIGRSWQWSTGFGQLKTVLYFKIKRDGTISEIKVKKSSGDRYFDQQSVRAIELSSPFPPLPEGYDSDDLGVFFEFGFKQ